MTDSDCGHGKVLAEVIAWKAGRTEDMVCVLKTRGDRKTHIWTYVTPAGAEHLVIHQHQRAFVRWEVRTGALGPIVDEFVRPLPPARGKVVNLFPRSAP